jgi:hypothetical protein
MAKYAPKWPKMQKYQNQMPNFKVRSLYIMPLLKNLNTSNLPCYKIAYLGENVKKIA